MNVKLFMYLKQYLVGICLTCHTSLKRLLDMKTGTLWTHFPVPFIFLSFAVPRFCGFFFVTFVVNIYRFYSLNYSVARLGAGEAYWLIYIILHFVLGFIDLC